MRLIAARRTYGLIPACAGKTTPGRDSAGRCAAHPRVCGENSGAKVVGDYTQGSSPRVRGKLGVAFTILWNTGLIPACAGKTLPGGTARSGPGAHPRVCGENLNSGFECLKPGGSSPRVRGKPREEAATIDMGGLIPACAGKTA